MIQGAPHVFENGAGRQEKDQEVLTAQLYQQIGQLKVERDFLSRSFGLRAGPNAGPRLTEKNRSCLWCASAPCWVKSRSSLYYLPTEAGAEDLELMALIDQQYLKTPFYGSRRMTAWPRNHGHQVNRKRVRRLMQLIGLEAIYRRPNTSKPNPGHKVYPYLLRGLEINRVNQVWATDITYIPMARGFLYLVAIMDWHSRYVLAWRLSNTLEVDFCVEALEEALSKGRPQIFNTDQGSQFTSEAFTSMLLAQGVQVSMDGRGRCMDNVFVERLWRSIKYEEVYLKAYPNGTEARKGIGAYLAFYNQERPHQALGYRSPGQVFQAVSPQRCLLELPRALPSDEGLRDTPAVDSLILASPLP